MDDIRRSMVRAARDTHGRVTPATLRQEVLDGGLAAELLAEQATTLAQLGRRLDEAVSLLAQIRQRAEATEEADHEMLLAEDAEGRATLHRLRWELQVVKEAMGPVSYTHLTLPTN